MRLVPICVTLALLALSACQSTPPGARFVPACTQHRYDAGMCELPSNFNLFATIITGRLQ